MKLKLIEHIKLTKELVDREHFFSVGYCEAIETHLMKVLVSWAAGYERYYRISADDYALFEEDRPAFYELYKNELSEDNECFTQKFMGAQALKRNEPFWALCLLQRSTICSNPLGQRHDICTPLSESKNP